AAQHVGLLNLRRPDVLSHLSMSAGLFSHFAQNPLNIPDGVEHAGGDAIVARQVTSELGIGIGFFDLVQLSASTPVVLAQWGNFPSESFQARSSAVTGFPYGDTRLAVDIVLVKPEWNDAGIGLSASGRVRLPTGRTGDLTSDGQLRTEPRLAFMKQWEKGHEIVANAGLSLGNPITVPRFHYTDAGMLGAGVGGVYSFSPTVELMGSVFGQGSVADQVRLPKWADAEQATNSARSFEALAGLRLNFGNFRIQGGGGLGLNDGLPAPDYRVFTSLHWKLDTTDARPTRNTKPRVAKNEEEDRQADEESTEVASRDEKSQQTESEPSSTPDKSDDKASQSAESEEQTKVARAEQSESSPDSSETTSSESNQETEPSGSAKSETTESTDTAEQETSDATETAKDDKSEPSQTESASRDTSDDESATDDTTDQTDDTDEKSGEPSDSKVATSESTDTTTPDKEQREPPSIDERIQFGKGSAELTGDARAALRSIADRLKS
ncbi:MAG: hypothetical protein ABEN55_23315, partial [Bradymonadaceae bacterium]